MKWSVILVLWLVLAPMLVVSQKDVALRKRKSIKQRLRNGGKVEEGHVVNALDIAYPLKFFESDTTHDWRRPARFSEKLKAGSAKGEYLEFALAQDQEDVWIYENWFFGMENGVIMESGALNGLTFSTSYLFETFANWTAVHVEADPENYSNLRGNRENAVNVHAALCSESRLLHYSSLGVIPVRGFVEFMTPSFLKKWHGPIYNGKVKIEDLPTTQCVPVKKLLRELNVQHIDVWILDTEGAEESVLRGTDFSAVHINSVAMECDEHDLEKNARKTDILEANNFKCQLVERNCMCKNKAFRARSAPIRSDMKRWDGNKWAVGGKVMDPWKEA